MESWGPKANIELRKSHAESMSTPSYPVLSMFHPFMVTKISAVTDKFYGEKKTEVMGFKRKMQKKSFKFQQSNLPCSSTFLPDPHPKMGFCHFPPSPKPALLFPKGRICT